MGSRRVVRFWGVMAAAIPLGLCSFAFGQNPQLQTVNGQRFPTVIFTWTLWTADPSYYSIAVDSSGSATYRSAPTALVHSGVPYMVEFQVGDRTRREIFNLSQNLEYFGQEIKTSVDSPENSGVRTLSYRYSRLNNEITYSNTSNEELEEITSIFEGVSETLESGRRLNYFHEHNPEELDSELTNIASKADHHRLRDLQALSATLYGIASDKRLAVPTRHKAELLLNRIHTEIH